MVLKMKKLLAIIVLGLLTGCATTNESFNTINSQNKYIKLALTSKTNASVKIAKADETGIWLMGEKYGLKNVWSVNPNKGNEYFLQTAKNYCSSLKKNTYLNYKKASVARHKWGGLQGDSHYHSQFDYYEKGLLIEDKQYWASKYVCANNKKEALTSPGSWIKREHYSHPVTASHRGKWKTNEYKRKLSQQEVVENKEQALEDKRKAAALKQKQRDNLITKLENIYSKDCTGGLLSKKFEKGTKEYENCLLEKDKIAKAKVETEKKAIAKRQIEIDKKLAAMTPKERHAYNCSTAFKFRKGTEKYNDCVFKLYTAELDMQKLELEKQVAEAQIQAAANQQARAEAVANAQIAAAKAAKRAASLNSSIQMMQMGSSMLGSSAPKSNSSFGIENRVRTTCRNVGGFINCN